MLLYQKRNVSELIFKSICIKFMHLMVNSKFSGFGMLNKSVKILFVTSFTFSFFKLCCFIICFIFKLSANF